MTASPVTRLALAVTGGAAAGGLPEAAGWAPLLSILVLGWLVRTWWRPGRTSSAHSAPIALAAGFLGGFLLSATARASSASDCRFSIPDGSTGIVTGRFLVPLEGAATLVPFELEGGFGDDSCTGTVRASLPRNADPIEPGARVWGHAFWFSSPPGRGFPPERAGRVVWIDQVRTIEAPAGIHPDSPLATGPSADSATGGAARLREPGLPLADRVRLAVQARIRTLFPDRYPVVEALVLARKEALDPAVRTAFVRSGTAHLLAISGFHVGVIAFGLLAGLRAVGLSHAKASLFAAGGVWVYVLGIGVPDAAARAALLITLLAASRLAGRPTLALGALSSAGLLLVLADPAMPTRIGAQLSFAGAAGLVFWARPVERWVRARSRGRVPTSVASAVGAGVGAGLGTLPFLAWHFGEVSLVGIPATLALGPAVALAIPGVITSLLLSVAAPPLGAFVAGGVELILEGVVRGAELFGAPEWAVLATPRSWIVGGGLGAIAAHLVWIHAGRLLRAPTGRPGILENLLVGPRVPGAKARLLATGTLCGVILAPIGAGIAGAGTLEIVFLDVGQGDGIVLRTPRGRWILVDAGPASASWDAGERRIVPYLRARGVDGLELAVFTHPDLDHIGGGPAVLRAFPSRAVLDPGDPVGKGPYQELLAVAAGRSATAAAGGGATAAAASSGRGDRRGRGPSRTRWHRARDLESFTIDEVHFRILHPRTPPGPGADANERSVVLEVRYGLFTILLTGDAGLEAEQAILPEIQDVDVLKVGHHGSRTSTGQPLLDRTRPEVAVIPVGWGNRYGHPHGEVVDRLTRAGIEVRRTDLEGPIRLRARRNGVYEVE